MWYDTGFVCVDCGKPIMGKKESCSAGYTILPDGGHICYDCAAERDAQKRRVKGE
jgi:hypothetical protein